MIHCFIVLRFFFFQRLLSDRVRAAAFTPPIKVGPGWTGGGAPGGMGSDAPADPGLHQTCC